jgi:hypothetical protein
MQVRHDDFRPVSALPAEWPSFRELVGGLLGGLFGASFLGLVVFADVAGALDALRADEEVVAREKPTVVEASFVQLGRDFDPRELPDRQVDRSSFVKARPREVATADARPKTTPEDDAGVKPVDAYENLLDQLGNRADFYDRISRAEMEGSADGVAEGNQKEGDAYRGTLYALFRRGLRAPPTVPDDVLRSLRAQVEFRITDDLRIRGLRLSQSSGNDDFDRAVRTRVEEIEESDPVLPEPPAASRATFVGPPIQMVITPPKSVARSAPPPPKDDAPAPSSVERDRDDLAPARAPTEAREDVE